MDNELKNLLLEIIHESSNELIESWISQFDENEKDDEYRYYDDFLGFFEECIIADLNLDSPEAEALKHFLEKLIEIKGEQSFFNFKDSVYTCYLKFPFFEMLEKKGEFKYDYVKTLTTFFEGITSDIIIELLRKNEEIQESTLIELEEREAPISEIWRNAIMVSIVGALDSNRILKIIDKILAKLERSDIEHVIVDIGSISAMNSEVASQLIKLNNAIHYMGAKAYLTGITPDIAKSLTHLDINLGDIKTFSTTYKAMESIVEKAV